MEGRDDVATGVSNPKPYTLTPPPNDGDDRDAAGPPSAAASKTKKEGAKAPAKTGRGLDKPLATPRTCAEFEASWKRLKSDPDDTRRRALLASMDARDVPTLFRGGVPTSVFAEVVAAAPATSARRRSPRAAARDSSLPRGADPHAAVRRGGAVAGGKQKRAMARAWDEAVAAAAGDAAARLAEARKAYRV